jgi:hypothetical protein
MKNNKFHLTHESKFRGNGHFVFRSLVCVYCYFPETLPTQFYLGRWSSYITKMQLKLLKSHFQENSRFVFWVPSERGLFLDLDCSDSLATDLRQTLEY